MTTFIPASKAQTAEVPRLQTPWVFMLGLVLGAGLVGLSFSFPTNVGMFPWLLVSGLVVVVSCLMGLGFCVLAEATRKRRERAAFFKASLAVLLETGEPLPDPSAVAYNALSTLDRRPSGKSPRRPH